MNKIKTVLLLLSTAGLLAACGEAESSAPVPTPTPSSSTSAPSSSSSSSSSQSSSSSASTGATSSTGTQTAPTSATQPSSSDPQPTSSEPEPTSQSSDPSSEPEPTSSVPVEYNTYVVNGLPEWITMDDCVIFAWAWGGEAGEGAWIDLDFINDGEAASFEIEGEIDGFLLVRCVAGTEIPDWNASGDVEGRIYNKTNDITCIIGVYEYQSPEWVDYEGGSGEDPIDPPGPGPIDPGEEGTYVINGLPEWITDDGCVIFAWAWGGEAEEGAWFSLDFLDEGAAVTFTVDGELDGMLLARCIAGTETPDWTAVGDVEGRIYNKTGDITCEPGVFTYASPEWVGYEYDGGGDPVDPGTGGDPVDPVDPGEEGTYVIDNLPDWITNDGCVIFAWAWGGEAGGGDWFALDFIEEGTAVSFDVEGELDGMLLARCAAETTRPDWSLHTDEPGRVYNQTEDITCQPGVFRYNSPAWKEYK